MPSYEMAILYKVMTKDKLTEALKKTADLIFSEGGIIRKLNNLGTHPTPFKISKHGTVHKQASYFVYEFDCPASSIVPLKGELYKYDYIVRRRIFSPVTPISADKCKIEEEMQIAPFRKEVQEMLRKAKAEREYKDKSLKPNHGLDYDPFPL